MQDEHSLPSHLLDELAGVYARAAARAYFAGLTQEEAQQCGNSSPAQVDEKSEAARQT